MRKMQVCAAIAAIPFACLLSTVALAGDCQRLAAAGDGLTKDIAVVMSTHGLQNIIDHKGLKGKGPVKTTCVPGAIMTECRSSQLACK